MAKHHVASWVVASVLLSMETAGLAWPSVFSHHLTLTNLSQMSVQLAPYPWSVSPSPPH